jgi:hypothetical protein
VQPYVDPASHRSLLVSYRIKDGSKIFPVAHFWMKFTDDIRDWIQKIVDNYLEVQHLAMMG